jgi:hypothetical protein
MQDDFVWNSWRMKSHSAKFTWNFFSCCLPMTTQSLLYIRLLPRQRCVMTLIREGTTVVSVSKLGTSSVSSALFQPVIKWTKYLNIISNCLVCVDVFYNSHSGGCSPYWVHLARRPLLPYWTCPGLLRGWRIWWNKDCQGKQKYSERPCPSATLSTTNPTWPDPSANLDCLGGKPATNRLNYRAAMCGC